MEKIDYLKNVRTSRYRVFTKKEHGSTRDYVCFSGLTGSDTKKIQVFIYENKFENITTNHTVILEKEQVTFYLGLLKRYFGGITKYKCIKNVYINVEINDNYSKEKTNQWIIDIDFDTLKIKNNRATKLTLYTHLRYLFEKPYSTILQEAFILHKKYKKYSLLQWLLLTHVGKSYGYGHCLMMSSYNTSKRNKKTDRLENKEVLLYKKFNINKIKISKETQSNNNLYSELGNFNKKSIKQINKIFKNEGISSRIEDLRGMDFEF